MNNGGTGSQCLTCWLRKWPGGAGNLMINSGIFLIALGL